MDAISLKKTERISNMINKKFTPDTVFLRPLRNASEDALNQPKPAAKTTATKTTSPKTQQTTKTTTSSKPKPFSQINREDAEAEKAKKKESTKAPTSTGSAAARTPRMSAIQKDEDGVRRRQPKEESATEQELRNKLFDEPIVKKRDRDRSGAEEVSDDWRNPLNPHSPFARNGAKVRAETDSKTGGDATIRFAGTSDEVRRKQYDNAMKRAATATDDLYHMLEWAEIDVNNLTAEQDEVIDLVKRELIKKSVLGTLTRDEKQKILRNTQQYIYNETTSANGDPYPVFVDIVSGGNQLDELIPPLGTVNTGVLSKDKLRQVLEYGEQGSADEVESKTAETMRKYKDRVYWEAIYAYNKDAVLGRVEPGGLQDYYDQAVLKFYERCLKPVPIQNQKGAVIDTVMIGELISPYSNELGTQVARKALERLGDSYSSVDCSQLVKWAFGQLNPDWGKYGIGSHAEYQRDKNKPYLQIESESDQISESDLVAGDLLYWKDSEGVTVHTAIYLGSGYMIESWHDVRITKLRQKTHLGGGVVSTLFQVNRMTEEKLDENVKKYKH